MKENWLTKKPKYSAGWGIGFLVLIAVILSAFEWFQFFRLDQFIKVNPQLVFEKHQYYRLWTSLFVHGDSAHLIGNLALFIPLVYLLTAYFGFFVGLAAPLFFGGVINWIVLRNMPDMVYLIGISGVVNWLGAVWLTLFYFIDLRESRRRRFALVLFITFLLYVPSTYKPEISYISHVVGYVLGFIFAVIYYGLNRQKFKNSEIFETHYEDDFNVPTQIPSHTVSKRDVDSFETD